MYVLLLRTGEEVVKQRKHDGRCMDVKCNQQCVGLLNLRAFCDFFFVKEDIETQPHWHSEWVDCDVCLFT